jgi:mannose-6-phosphate isomerase
VAPGDFFYVPAGTVHAIGAGVALLEFQQNSDVTYRLYDYGRPRELHLKDGTAVSKTDQYAEHYALRAGGAVNAVLHNGPDFCLVRVSSTDKIPLSLSSRLRWVMPLEGTVSSRGERASAGECLLLGGGAPLSLSRSAVVLIGASGPI